MVLSPPPRKEYTDNIANCDLYYSYLPALTGTCHAQDQATTSLHEFTHASAVVSPSTQDYAYGYSASTARSASQALQNADTYALFANGTPFLPSCIESCD